MKPAIPELDVPRFSLAERERRWGRVRRLMERDGIDVIVAPSNTGGRDGLQANVRYLTGMGVNSCPVAAIFPGEGEVTALTGPVPYTEYWLGFQDWVTDVRSKFFSEGDAIIERLRELPIERGRIGIAGLAAVPRMPDGIVSHGIYMKIREAFPHAELVNATHLMDEARFVKSEEEIAFLERSVELVEGAIETMIHEARPGVPECVVYARMLASMVEQGGELPTMILWAAGTPQPLTNAFMPTRRRLQQGDIITSEVEAHWGGYVGQVTFTGAIGKVPSEYAEMYTIQQEIIDRAYERFRPGTLISEFLNIGEEATRGTPYESRMIMHSRGLGNDAPIAVFGTRDERIRTWRIEENAVFVIKPVVMTREWISSVSWGGSVIGDSQNAAGESGAKTVCWGDSVVATPSGARRLGKRPRNFIEIG
ncbi:MAG: aminopeptidase P family protein [Ktedonobacteraceae bacterium]|nr:aminopeptidase P family protein [Ktedonobacteraceae bacterium]